MAAPVNETQSATETPEPAVVDETPAIEPEAPAESLFSRMVSGLNRTRGQLSQGLGQILLGKKEIDEDLLEEIETQLLMADIGVEACTQVINAITEKSERKELKDADAVYQALKTELANLLADKQAPLEIEKRDEPFVILVVGVNGVGKTTTIGKMAKRFQNQGLSVMLAAGDTFRAAAVEQLQVWGERNDVPVVAQHTGADSASVIFDAVESARSKNIDVIIADTAGRLQNKDNLMSELEKVVRVMKK
ncbi:signal recognition particle-docking protein FtsY, partial [Oleiphilus sp. HI0122]